LLGERTSTIIAALAIPASKCYIIHGRLVLPVKEDVFMPHKMEKVMKEYGKGMLHSGSKRGPKVTSRPQAIAIGLSEARKAGEKVPPPKKGRK